ncbi:MAG TPA: sensor histidine kinase KdpD [Anaerolineae bacterium]
MSQVQDPLDLSRPSEAKPADEARLPRGRLKIFLGYAAGVGTTYAMLEAAGQRRAEGVDVVVACVETHERAEMLALVSAIEVIPRLEGDCDGVAFAEMDVDAVLARRPQLALVDELAHSNAAACRHSKRYLDVEELLAAGINVYATLNIQEVESLSDVVAQITGARTSERVPDSVLDEADDIELVDLPPQELLARLEEGKVATSDPSLPAAPPFYRLGNLTALRELAMRRAAGRVDDQMRAYMRTRAIPGPWPAVDRLLVCVSQNAAGEKLVRATKRLAQDLDAEWFALYVEVPGHGRLSAAARDTIAGHLRLAEELGAKAISLPGHAVAETVLEYARGHNVTKIIVGKPIRPAWIELLRGSVVNQVIARSGSIDVYVITSEKETPAGAPTLGPAAQPRWKHYAAALALVGITTLLSAILDRVVTPANLVMLYLATVVVVAMYLGRGPAILTALLSVLVFDFFFVPPHLTFLVADTQYLLTFAGFLIVGLVISSLTGQAREQAESAQAREAQAIALYEFSRDLSVAHELDAVLQATISHVGQTFNRQAAIFLPGPDGRLQIARMGADLELDDAELAVADWTFRNGQSAGRGTGTLPSARARYLPLRTPRGVVGVLGVLPPDTSALLSPDQRRFMETFASQAALAIEQSQLAERARRTHLLEATEKLQSALLNSISHDLRTPLVTITGAFSNLEAATGRLDEATRIDLARAGREEAERLNRLVGNLLDITRIEAGALKLTEEPADVGEALGVVLDRLDSRLADRRVNIRIPDDLAAVPMDMPLIVQALYNVVDNALKYSPAGTPIDIGAGAAGDSIRIEIADRGVGISGDDLPHIFDKFYRVQNPGGVKGTGLGLSITKGIVEAHRGTISAAARPGGGTVITIVLPLEERATAAKD